ncbi:hypothetical protein NELON_04860 [Neisseria elongata subsp. glycolytica ATCC 29315]|uniref:Tape measure protein N-terminal domain-containing protein n=2 Tax=Neisseria elongata subsp. glycolytica ATCC 29315 TaxID=546263 RepID=A0A0B5CPZ9_NEIEG|nr:tape measure protein [Neisseria elongata]AJE18291.1 hypothetical protein NELON_04860 [Neisseria elongata subsp. glycolytica ATCC 29315]
MGGLSQIAGKGKVSMEELRGQLDERLTPAMAIAAKSMGVTTAELEKMVESGISAEAFLPKFGAAMEEAFAGAESAQASVNRLKNQFDELLLKFGEEGGINAAYQKLLDDVGAGLAWIEEKIGSLDGALTGSLSDAFVSAYDTAKTGAAEVAHLIETVIGYINEAGNALNTLLGAAGRISTYSKQGWMASTSCWAPFRTASPPSVLPSRPLPVRRSRPPPWCWKVWPKSASAKRQPTSSGRQRI